MFGRLKKRALARAIIADTEKTLGAVCQLSSSTQHAIARRVYAPIAEASQQLWHSTSDTAREQVIRYQLTKATEARQRALERGARDWSDPDWAAAALVEGWLMAQSGKFGQDALGRVSGLTMSWLRAVLTEDDLRRIERR